MPTHHLLIFVKNPVPGTVKTRIARTVGNEEAVRVYKQLLAYTQQITRHVSYAKTVYYADFINPNDGWTGYGKALQEGGDLGERMANAFSAQFTAGAERVLIIGSDCLTIKPTHIEKAFDALEQVDVVIGPATDGGYYLLGMKRRHEVLFTDMPWSQPNLLRKTQTVMLAQGLSFQLLDELTDIDEWTDYVAFTSDKQTNQ